MLNRLHMIDLVNVHEVAHISLMNDRLVPLIIERKATSFLLQKSKVQCVKARKLFYVITRAEVLVGNAICLFHCSIQGCKR